MNRVKVIRDNLQGVQASVTQTVINAMSQLNKSPDKTLFIVSDCMHLVGTLTDGDIRRSIISGNSLNMSIDKIYYKTPHFLYQDDISDKKVADLFDNPDVTTIPIVDDEKKFIGYISPKTLLKGDSKANSMMSMPVVIMAGGKGKRLDPFTKILPKPLIPIHGKAIIEHIIDRFVSYGNNEIYLTLNYKRRILKAFFDDHMHSDKYVVNYIDETIEQGTAGGLWQLKNKLSGDFFLSNCDVLVDIDLSDLSKVHSDNNNMITIVVSTLKHVLPYGSCDLDSDGSLISIIEKPEYNHLVSTGVYLINSNVLNYIPENKLYDMPKLIDDIITDGHRVGVYPVPDDAWIDVGQWSEYNNAIDKF